MAKIEITKTELVWPGKYNDDGSRKMVPRVNLPFQVIETINESRATREAKKVPQLTSSTSTRARRARPSRRAGATSLSGATICW